VNDLISYETVAKVLRRIADEQPNRKVSTYRYLVCGEPSCLIAVLLERLGVDREVMRELDREDASQGAKMISLSRHKLWDDFDKQARVLMQSAQMSQDNGCNWKTAVEYAIQVAEKVDLK